MPNNAIVQDDPATWLAEHGDYLYSMAMKQLQNQVLAEDAVQETLLAALRSKETYAGQSSLRTWLTGILKFKIIDSIRNQSREQPIQAQPLDLDRDGAEVTSLFDHRGEWVKPSNHWGNPEWVFDQALFWQAFSECLQHLPPKLARTFSLRELSGIDTDQICEILDISSNNCWVLLYRARVALKKCLESNWFESLERRN